MTRRRDVSTVNRTARVGRGVPALLYHHVGPPRAGTYASLTIRPSTFERQIRWLARRGFRGISSDEFLGWLEGRPLPSRAVLLTFDDGYADLADFALPVLQRWHFPAIVFLVSARIGEMNSWDNVHGSATHPLLAAGQIREWSRRGIEFGAHGRTHADLTSPHTNVRDEVAGSAADLDELLGRKARCFAYPHGAFDEKARACVASHFELAFTADEGLNDRRTDRHLLHRTMIQPSDTLLDLQCKLITGSSPVERLRTTFRIRTRLRAAKRVLERQSLIQDR
jgi:peptidoglycan/xylan/chitin deacetylase (PgdA/CDA1 family)